MSGAKGTNEDRVTIPECEVTQKSAEIPEKANQSTDEKSSSSFRAALSKLKGRAQKVAGILLAAASGLLLTLYSAIYKLIKKDIDNSTVLILRGFIQIIIMSSILLYQRTSLKPKNMEGLATRKKALIWFTFLLVGIFGGFRLCFIFAALEKIPMALVHTILNGSPVVIMVLAHFVLKDPCNILRTMCTFGLVAGVILILQPQKLIDAASPKGLLSNSSVLDLGGFNVSEFDNSTVTNNCSTNSTDNCGNPSNLNNDLLGYGFSIAALVFSAVGSVLTKKITTNFDKMVITLFLGVSVGIMGWIQLATFAPKAPVLPTNYYPWIMAILVAVLGVAQQFCLVAALKLESPTRVTVIRSLQIVVSFIVQAAVWNEKPGLDQIFGAIIILSAICIVTFENPILAKANSCSEAYPCDCCKPSRVRNYKVDPEVSSASTVTK